MPLVVPELAPGNTDDWQNKLVGKKISESTSDVTVCSFNTEGVAFSRYLLSGGFLFSRHSRKQTSLKTIG